MSEYVWLGDSQRRAGLLNSAQTSPGQIEHMGSALICDSGVVLKVYVDHVDHHFARAKAQGATIVSDPQDAFWGGRIYRVLDHEGHHWEISQRGRGIAAHRWQLRPGLTRGVRA